MKPSPESLRELETRPSAEVASWLAQGFLRSAREDRGDPFMPHSFVHNSPHPAEAIRDLYAAASFDLQRAILRGIVMVGAMCRTKSLESESLLPEQRFMLIQAFLAMCTDTRCIEAAQTVENIAYEDEKDWEPVRFRRKIFPECMLCLEEIAFHFGACTHKAATDRNRLTSSLVRMVQSPQFQHRFAPRLLAALVAVNPEQLEDHLTLLGPHVGKFHKENPQQEQLAYLTARRIVEDALHHLRQIFGSLQFGSPAARDQWLLLALFGEKGPLRAVNIGRDEAIGVFIDARIDQQMTFYHEGVMRLIHHWLPGSSLPEPPDDHVAAEIMRKMSSGSGTYFGKTPKNFDHAVRKH